MAVCSRINLASHAGYKNGHPRFGASLIDAYICIMVWIHCTVGSAAWKDVATISHWKRAPPRIVVLFVVQIPEGPLPMACPRGAKGGCDRPVLARLIMLLRAISVPCGPDSPALRRRRPRSAKHPGRPRRAERRTEFAVSLGRVPGWIAGSLYLLPHHAAERPKERRCLLQNLFLTSKSPWKLMRRASHRRQRGLTLETFL